MTGIIVGNRRQIALRLTPAEFEWDEKRATERGRKHQRADLPDDPVGHRPRGSKGSCLMDHILADLNAASSLIEKSENPICEYCGATEGLRITADGGMWAFGFRIQPAQYTCEGCFKGTDTGPSFDDLPAAEGSAR